MHVEHSVDSGNLLAPTYLLDHGADISQEGEEGATVPSCKNVMSNVVKQQPNSKVGRAL